MTTSSRRDKLVFANGPMTGLMQCSLLLFSPSQDFCQTPFTYTATKGLKSESGAVVSDNCRLRAAFSCANSRRVACNASVTGYPNKAYFEARTQEFVKTLNGFQYKGILQVSVFKGFQA
jgi:hypothetical protein